VPALRLARSCARRPSLDIALAAEPHAGAVAAGAQSGAQADAQLAPASGGPIQRRHKAQRQIHRIDGQRHGKAERRTNSHAYKEATLKLVHPNSSRAGRA
jgi:hypothetical protein